jgi:hypothetical protein
MSRIRELLRVRTEQVARPRADFSFEICGKHVSGMVWHGRCKRARFVGYALAGELHSARATRPVSLTGEGGSDGRLYSTPIRR